MCNFEMYLQKYRHIMRNFHFTSYEKEFIKITGIINYELHKEICVTLRLFMTLR